ncbi:MAG: hypothetical protein HZB16_20885 [Armatimonadetes bacterium]|nr:hypothetical protein [Armatimonadota bacterium]
MRQLWWHRRPRRWLAMGTVPLVLGTAWAQQAPLHYDLDRPLCRQMQLSPDLIGALTPPSAAVLGVPAAVQVAAPLGGVGAVRIGATPVGAGGAAPVAGLGGLGAVKLDLGLPAPTTGGQSAILLARVRAGDQGPELEAALRKAPAADLLAEVQRCPWWSEPDQVIADRLLTVLIERGDIDLKQPDTLAPDVALMAAECLRRRVDARCVPIFEHLLAQQATKPADTWVQPVYGLATYYRLAGDYQRSAEVWLSGDRYTTSPATLDDFRLEAAWTKRAGGDVAGADQIEDELLKSTSGAAWTIGLVTYGRAQRLLLSGKHSELRELLRRDLPLGGPAAKATEAAAVRVALDGLLADSYARTGERELAAAQYRKVLRGFEALPAGRGGNGLDNVVATARVRLAELAGPGGH